MRWDRGCIFMVFIVCWRWKVPSKTASFEFQVSRKVVADKDDDIDDDELFCDIAPLRGVLRTQWNILNEAFAKILNSWKPLSILKKTLYLRCSTGLLIRHCLYWNVVRSSRIFRTLSNIYDGNFQRKLFKAKAANNFSHKTASSH